MSDMNETERWYAYGDENGNGPWNDDIDPDYEVGICQNCDAPLMSEQAQRGKLFCSERCKQTAKAVRYARASRRDGRSERDPEVIRAILMKIRGYPAKERALSPAQREAIFVRDNRMCQICGATATDIDHIAGSSSNPENLQALCKPCNMAKAEANLRPATAEKAAESDAIWTRIRAKQPSRLCDDENKWDELWREIASEQRELALQWSDKQSDAEGNH